MASSTDGTPLAARREMTLITSCGAAVAAAPGAASFSSGAGAGSKEGPASELLEAGVAGGAVDTSGGTAFGASTADALCKRRA